MDEHEHNSSGWWDLFSAITFFFALITAASRLAATGWVRNLDLVATVTMFGLFAGLALGKSIFSRLISFLFGLFYGLFVIPWQLGLTLGVDGEWIERLTIMVDRIREIVLDIVLREPVTDNLFFLFLMATLFWIISVYSSFQLIRNGNVWRALLPGGVALITIQNYDPHVSRRTWYLAVYIFMTLVILARNYYLKEQRRWHEKRTFVPPDAGFDFGRYALLITLIIVLLAWNSPALADSLSPVSDLYKMIEEPWLKAKEEMSYLFASLRATVGLVSDYYADVQPLGRGNVNADTEVMKIEVPRVEYSGQRYYWRARVYDFYQDAQWSSTIEDLVEFSPASDKLPIPDAGDRETVEANITPRTALVTLYTPTQPIWFSRPGDLNAYLLDDSSFDIVNMEASPFIRPGETYQARASIPAVTQFQMRDAGVDYPQWVLDRYLQVPDEITPRTRLLAERLAEGRETPFDVVNAVTFWLRENIEYVEFIDEPPANQERIDWFLFEYQKGFCNYYSTAMIMLLRSAGIPSRWAVGYAQGNRVSGGSAQNVPEELRDQLPELFADESSIYLIKQIDAHAWPEVYFPGIGWVEFEPTVSQNPLVRPRGFDPNSTGGQSSTPFFMPDNYEDLPIPDDFPDSMGASSPIQEETPSGSGPVIRLVLGLAGILLIVVVIVFRRSPDKFLILWDRFYETLNTPFTIHLVRGFKLFGFRPPAMVRRLAYEASLSTVAKSFMEVNHAITRFRVPIEPSATPTERVQLLMSLLPVASKDSQVLLQQYHLETYSSKSTDSALAIRAGESLRRLSIQNWFERALNQIVSPFQGRVQSRGAK